MFDLSYSDDPFKYKVYNYRALTLKTNLSYISRKNKKVVKLFKTHDLKVKTD